MAGTFTLAFLASTTVRKKKEISFITQSVLLLLWYPEDKDNDFVISVRWAWASVPVSVRWGIVTINLMGLIQLLNEVMYITFAA